MIRLMVKSDRDNYVRDINSTAKWERQFICAAVCVKSFSTIGDVIAL